ncbi:MAG: threonylcarbamoyl-AMP synthase [Magnetococcales bacterium]|nr:threonylcarbamoyl-AMP synthase [Magnetococcales bacterium]
MIDATHLTSAIHALNTGQVIACPTGTLYGFTVDAGDRGAHRRLMRLKSRTTGHKGVILLVNSEGMARRLIASPPLLARALMRRFWPGALTLVLPARSTVPESLTGPAHAGKRWIALRHDLSPVVQALLSMRPKPLVSTSINRSGEPPMVEPERIQRRWGRDLGMIMPGSVHPDATPSTVLRVEEGCLTVLRAGAFPIATLRSRFPHVEIK